MIPRFRVLRLLAFAALVVLVGGAFMTAPATSISEGTLQAAVSLAATSSVTATVSVDATIPAEWPLSAKRYVGKVIHSVVTKKHEVALTFDDGPSGNCETIIAMLKSADASATFFFCGRTIRGPGVADVHAAALAGMDVGNHTFNHVELRKVSPATWHAQVQLNEAVLERVIGFAPRFVRPRSGIYDRQTVARAKADGLGLILWSRSAADAGAHPSVAAIVRKVTSKVRSGDIILMHETNPDTAAALPAILRELKRKGLKAVTVSRLLADATKVR